MLFWSVVRGGLMSWFYVSVNICPNSLHPIYKDAYCSGVVVILTTIILICRVSNVNVIIKQSKDTSEKLGTKWPIVFYNWREGLKGEERVSQHAKTLLKNSLNHFKNQWKNEWPTPLLHTYRKPTLRHLGLISCDFHPFERQSWPLYFQMPLNFLQHLCTLWHCILERICSLWMGIEGINGLPILFKAIAGCDWVRFPEFHPFERQAFPLYFLMTLNFLQQVCTLYLGSI